MQQVATSLGQYFKGRLFKIPDYQRSYAWTKRHHKDLWEDLTPYLGSHEGKPKHFLGTLILKPLRNIQDYEGEVFEEFEVIDGQQRLTALVILMACIGRRLWSQRIAQNLYDQFVAYCKAGEPVRTLRKLRLGDEDDTYFWEAILDVRPAHREPTTPGQRRLHQAKSFFEEQLNPLPAEELARFATAVQQQVMVLTYQVTEELEAGLIFETINDRGKSLSQLDKIKSYLMYLAAKTNDSGLADAVQTNWGQLLRNIAQLDPKANDTEEEENRLVRYHWIMGTGKSDEYEIHRALKKEYPLSEGQETSSKAREYMRRLCDASEFYLMICHSELPDRFPLDDSSRTKISNTLGTLNRLERTGPPATLIPLLMAALQRYHEREPAALHEIIWLSYLFAWRAYSVCGRRSDAAQGELSRLAHQVYSSPIDANGVATRLRELIKWYADDGWFQQNLLGRNPLSREDRKLFLYDWEVYLAEQARQAPLSWESVKDYQIEHICPQTPKGMESWPEKLKEQHQRFVNRLGNLALISPPWNPELSNRPLHEKQDTYLKANLAMVRALPTDLDFRRVTELEKAKAPLEDVLEAAKTFVDRRTEWLVAFAEKKWLVSQKCNHGSGSLAQQW